MEAAPGSGAQGTVAVVSMLRKLRAAVSVRAGTCQELHGHKPLCHACSPSADH